MSSKVLSDVIVKYQNDGGNGKVNVLLATAITLFPLLIDNIFNDTVYMCPHKNRKFYSLFLMLAPSTCAVVLGLILTLQYFRNHDELGHREILRKLMPRIFITLIIICITFGSSFIFSKYYVCYHLDPIVKDEAIRAYLINESRQIGWIIILSGLMVLFTVTMLQFTLFYPSKLERTWNMFKMMQFNTANNLLKEKLNELAKRSVLQQLGEIAKDIENLENYCDEKVSGLIQKYHRIESAMILATEERGIEFLRQKIRLKSHNMYQSEGSVSLLEAEEKELTYGVKIVDDG